MKICHLLNSYPLPTGGMQTYCYDLAEMQSNQGHDVNVYVSGVVGSMSENKHIKVRSFKPLFNIGKATISPSLIPALLKGHFDIIHIHLPIPFGFEVVLCIAKIKRIPIVVTYHCETIYFKENHILGYLMKFYTILNTLLLNFVDHIIFTTKDYSNQFKFPNSKVSIIPIGVDTDRFKILDKVETRKQINLPISKYIVLFVGNIDIHNYYKKGVEYLLDAIPLIRKEIPNIYVNIVGVTDNNTKKIINTICDKNKTSDIAHLSGFVSDEDLPKHYAASNVMVLPSISKLEAFGIVLIEAMASGLPVIATNIPGVRSVVKSSKAGFLVEPKSSSDIAKAILNVYKSKELEKYAINTAKTEYSWERITNQVIKVYKDLVRA